MQILIKCKVMKTRIFASLFLVSLFLLSCNQNEILDDPSTALSYLEDGVWKRDKAYFVQFNLKTGKIMEIHDPIYGDVYSYFVFDKGVHNRYISFIDPSMGHAYTSYIYRYSPDLHEFQCRKNEEDIYPAIEYKVVKVTKKYIVLDENPYVNNVWLRYRLKRISWEEFEQTDCYKEAHEKVE